MRKTLLIIISLVVTLLVCEIILHSYVKRSVYGYGHIFDKELPPKYILPPGQVIRPEEAELERNNWYNRLVVNGKRITKGDLWGILREDEFLGFTSKENAITTNKWWQSNNIGARSTKDTSYKKSPEKERILIFGDSFAHSSRVPQNETIDFYLNQLDPNIEVFNLGVDGYGLAQSYMRFQTLRDRIEYDNVILFFVPRADLEREINIHRYLGLGWFSSHAINIQPRYIIKDGQLMLIKSPYKNLDELLEKKSDSISKEMKEHLRAYDSYYSRLYHETIPILDRSILFKLITLHFYNKKISSLKDNLWNPGSEAVKVSRSIIYSMNKDVKEEGGQFILVILPTIYDILDKDYVPGFQKKWEDIANFICSDGIDCLDIMEDFSTMSFHDFDAGYEGTHFGPKTNKFIAELILENRPN